MLRDECRADLFHLRVDGALGQEVSEAEAVNTDGAYTADDNKHGTTRCASLAIHGSGGDFDRRRPG